MSASTPASGLLQQRPFVLFWLARVCAGVNVQEFGAVGSVPIGGIGSLVVAGLWMLLFPGLRKIDRFEPADPEKT